MQQDARALMTISSKKGKDNEVNSHVGVTIHNICGFESIAVYFALLKNLLSRISCMPLVLLMNVTA